jgi:glucosylglycerate synthase
MPEPDAILQETGQNPGEITNADVIVGIPTYNNAETIEGVVEAAVGGLSDRLSSLRAVVVNADGGSRDGTPERLRGLLNGHIPLVQAVYPIYPVHLLAPPIAGVPGRAEALRSILRHGERLGVKACAVLDAGVEKLDPEWIGHLLDPVLNHGYDLVAPCYLRHKFEGAISNGVVYPFVRALYGRRVRQPMPSELAFSSQLIANYAAAAPADPWSLTPAILGRFQICQTFLGPHQHPAKELSPDLSSTLAQVLGSLFEEMERTVVFWQKVRGSETVSSFGPPFTVTTEEMAVNSGRMIESFRLGYQDLQSVWSQILSPAALLEYKKLSRLTEAQFRLADDLWARTVYDFGLAWHLRVMDRDHLLRAITPLYLGWAASSVLETQTAGPEEVEARQERLCLAFELQKRYLISRWRWPDRFNP